MKKFISILFILIFLSYNPVNAAPGYPSNVFTEGLYKISDLNLSKNNIYSIQNISNQYSVHIFLLDGNEFIIQTLMMSPNSEKYTLLPVNNNYKIIITGSGSVFFS